MLEVNIEKIVPVTDARDSLNKIVDEVNSSDELYVLTVNGKPAAVVVGVHHLEKLTGQATDAFTTPAAVPQTGAPSGAAAAADTTANTTDDTVDSTAQTEAPTYTEPVEPATPVYQPEEATEVPVETSAVDDLFAVGANPAAEDSNAQFVTPDADDLTNTPTNQPTAQ